MRGFEWYYWDRRIDQSAATFKADSSVTSIDWSPDGQTLYATDATGRLLSWDLRTGKRKILCAEEFGVKEVTASPQAQYLAAVGFKKGEAEPYLSLIDSATGDTIKRIELREILLALSCPCFSADGKVLAVGSGMGQIYLVDVESRKVRENLTREAGQRDLLNPTRILNTHIGQITSLIFSPDGESIASADALGTIAVWTLSGKCTYDSRNSDLGQVSGLAFDRGGKRLFARSLPKMRSEGTIRCPVSSPA